MLWSYEVPQHILAVPFLSQSDLTWQTRGSAHSLPPGSHSTMFLGWTRMRPQMTLKNPIGKRLRVGPAPPGHAPSRTVVMLFRSWHILSPGGLSRWLVVLLLPLCRCNALLAACSCHADDLLAKKAALCRRHSCAQFWSQVACRDSRCRWGCAAWWHPCLLPWPSACSSPWLGCCGRWQPRPERRHP